MDTDLQPTGYSLSTIPQGAGSRLDADTLRNTIPDDFIYAQGKHFKLVKTNVNINATINAGAIGTVSVTWKDPFSNTPVYAWAGEVTTGTSFERYILSISAVTKTGATLSVFNAGANGTPNYNVDIYCIGPI